MVKGDLEVVECPYLGWRTDCPQGRGRKGTTAEAMDCRLGALKESRRLSHLETMDIRLSTAVCLGRYEIAAFNQNQRQTDCSEIPFTQVLVRLHCKLHFVPMCDIRVKIFRRACE